MLRRLRELREDEDGQALVLGALLIAVLAVAVLGVSSLASAVHDRIRLQDAADASAYGLAVEEARAFNLYAYDNRAQISQYVTLLQFVSLDALVLGILAGLGMFAAVLKTLSELCAGPKKALCLGVPVIGEVLAVASTMAGMVEPIARTAARILREYDRFVGQVAVPALVGANLILYARQQATHARVLALLSGDEALRLARQTVPGAKLAVGVAGPAVNVARFEQAHLREAMELFGTGESPKGGLGDGARGRRNYARRGTAELIHATRSDSWVYDRRFPASVKNLLGGMEAAEKVEDFLGALPGVELRGHTRLLSDVDASSRDAEAIYERMERQGYGTARYPTGNAIGANEYFFGGKGAVAAALGMDRKSLASVTTAGKDGGRGFACTWDVDNPYTRHGIPGLLEVFVPRFTCDQGRGRHPWWGITPYMAFDASRPGCTDFASEHCQPDVWVGLEDGKATAVARAMAYYHRPGNWQEPPNFFNPFWRAKLAPVAPGLEQLGGKLLDAVPEAVRTKVLTH